MLRAVLTGARSGNLLLRRRDRRLLRNRTGYCGLGRLLRTNARNSDLVADLHLGARLNVVRLGERGNRTL